MTITDDRTDFEIDLSGERFGKSVPWETFRELRARGGVHWYEAAECWVITRHPLIGHVNRDFTTFSSAKGGIAKRDDPARPRRKVLVEQDPPEHTRYRSLVNANFSPTTIAGLQEMVQGIVDDVIRTFVENGGGDWVDDVAMPVPFRVMSRIAGVPESDAAMVIPWSNTMATSDDPEYRPSTEHVIAARAAYTSYCSDVIADRKANPREDDLLTNLIQYRDEDGWGLDDADLAGFVEILLTGGSETTRHLIAHMIMLLDEHRDQTQRFLEGEVRARSVVSETLRYVSPVLQHSRTATVDTEIDGHAIKEGDRLTLWMVSGNRDEDVFDNPDVYDVGRRTTKMITFGSGGPHFCLGSNLAQMEARLILEAIAPHLDRMSVTGPPVRMWSNFFNGIKHVPVEVR